MNQRKVAKLLKKARRQIAKLQKKIGKVVDDDAPTSSCAQEIQQRPQALEALLDDRG